MYHSLIQLTQVYIHQTSLVGSAGKESTRNMGDLDSVPGLGRSPGEGKGYSLQYSDFPCGSGGKASAYNVGDTDLIPRSERSSGEGNGNPLQYSCLENPMARGALRATVQGVAKESDTT